MVRLLERQSRLLDELVERVAPLGRVPTAWLARTLQAGFVIVLLALGVIAASTLAWVVLSMPMTLAVLLALLGAGESPIGAFEPRRRRPASRPLRGPRRPSPAPSRTAQRVWPHPG